VDVKPRQGIVEVEVTRGGRWESVHAVAWALAAADDRPADGTVAGLPDVFPRSAVKPLQALPVIETGAEGVSSAAVPGAGLGIAVKALDGAGRAAEIVMAALLGRHVPELPAAAAARLSERAAPVIRRGDGTPVGGLRLVAGSRLD
jgi:L-asparaginase II